MIILEVVAGRGTLADVVDATLDRYNSPNGSEDRPGLVVEIGLQPDVNRTAFNSHAA